MGKSGMVEKTLRFVLACLMAVILTVGLLPVMPREAVADTNNDSQGKAAINTSPVVRFDEQWGTSIALLEDGSLWVWGNNE